MSRRATSPLVFLLLVAVAIPAMGKSKIDERIDYIRKAYAQRISLMQNQPFENIKVNQATCSTAEMLPATGLYTRNDTFYWTGEADFEHVPEGSDESFIMDRKLYFAVSKEEVCHGAYRYYCEYLFDAETEQPLFCLMTTQLGEDSSTRHEFRFYLDENGQVIKQIPETIEAVSVTATYLPPEVGIVDNYPTKLLKQFEHIKLRFKALVD